MSGPGTPPRVMALVLNWCGEDDTAACLRSLLASDYPALEVLLIDNGSPDGSGERLHARFPDVPYLQTGANLGYTGGNNRGIERAISAGAEYVLVLNNDTVVDPGCVSALVRAGHSPGVGAVGPKILVHDAPHTVWFAGGDFSRLRGMGYHRLLGDRDEDPEGGACEEISFLTGCCMLIPVPVLREVGGFEEDFFAYMEDVEMSLRLRSRGYRLVYQPCARVFHRVPTEREEPTPFQLLHGTRNRRRLVRRRYRRSERICFNLFFYPSRAVRLVQYLARGDRDRAAALWRGITAA
jgi:GT2 family glycosyltransferase